MNACALNEVFPESFSTSQRNRFEKLAFETPGAGLPVNATVRKVAASVRVKRHPDTTTKTAINFIMGGHQESFQHGCLIGPYHSRLLKTRQPSQLWRSCQGKRRDQRRRHDAIGYRCSINP